MKRVVLLLLSSVILAGCSTKQAIVTPDKQEPLDWLQHAKSMQSINDWQANAKTSVKIGNKAQRATMVWQQHDQAYQIDFSGPFGHSGPKLEGDAQSATLTIPKEAPISGPNISDLLQQRLGWKLPVNNAKYWILGIPSPSSGSSVSLFNNRLAILEQDGWTINYSKYKQFGPHSLPTKILISRPNFDLLLVVYKWKFDSTTAL